jgi:predicted lipoprotein
MTRLTAPSRRSLLRCGGLAAAAMLAGCKVVPIAAHQAELKAQRFDPKAWAEGLWAPKVLPYFATNAKPLAEVAKAATADLDAAGKAMGYRASSEGSPWSFAVKGQGTVVKKNTTSRAGTLEVKLEDDPARTVIVQLGPVIIGSAIRDVLPFVNFADFTNQLEFADAGKALTALALAAIGPAAQTAQAGSRISFSGALSMTSKSDPIKVTPVSLEVVGA